MKHYTVAVVGATGAVGQSMLATLEQRKFPIDQIHLLASRRSAGNTVRWAGTDVTVECLDDFDFNGVDVALFSAGGSVSEAHAPRAAKAGAIVIDNTSCFRYDDHIPLVVPEVNPHHLDMLDDNNSIIANPNCSTIQMVVALHPIHKKVGIQRINVATYQAVSGSGNAALDELRQQTRKLMVHEQLSSSDASIYQQPIAGNVLPHIDVFLENGYTKEEMKMVWETRKIIGDASIMVNPTCVRVPVEYGHSEAVHLETREPIDLASLRQLLADSPGIVIKDDLSVPEYPTPLLDAAGQDPVFVGRIRKDITCNNGINMWIVSDNIRKGAALNSVQIAELLIAQNRI